MQNTLIGTKETEVITKILSCIDELESARNDVALTELMAKLDNARLVEKVHILFYMDMIRDLVKTCGALKSLQRISEEEFISLVTENGKESLKSVERKMMLNIMLEMADSMKD